MNYHDEPFNKKNTQFTHIPTRQPDSAPSKYDIDPRIGKIQGDQEIISQIVSQQYYGDWLLALELKGINPFSYIPNLIGQTPFESIDKEWINYFTSIKTKDETYQKAIEAAIERSKTL